MKAFIRRNIDTLGVDIFIGSPESGQWSKPITEDGTHEIVLVKPHEQPPIYLSLGMSDSKLIAEAFAEDSSFPKPTQAFAEGKLEATEKHLDDMRDIIDRLVLKKGK